MAAIGTWIYSLCVCGTEYQGPSDESIQQAKATCKKCAERAAMKARMDAANMFAPRGIRAVCDDLDKLMNRPLGELVGADLDRETERRR